MKRPVQTALITVLWASSLWICFWLGFLKSQTIASQTHHLDNLRSLSDQKALLENITAGKISKAQDELKERISLGESMVQIQVSPNYSFFDALLYAIYPREALTLIKVSNSNDREKK
ncbi:hypothetical protein QFZ41_003034 [Luteibacter sp. W1I16]|uniref:hypothetical protein n=1 Tax=Luteibacter sp. W1I16 TaxID=3373922 RepID=UPI003D22F2ED